MFGISYPEVETWKFHPILCSQKQVKLEPGKRNQAKFTLTRFVRCMEISVKVYQDTIVSQQVYDQCRLEIIISRLFSIVSSCLYQITSRFQNMF